MPRLREKARTDIAVESIREALEDYRAAHGKSEVSAFRHSPHSIYARIVDPEFKGRDWESRESRAWDHLEELPDELVAQIGLLVLVTPEEMKHSGSNQEFENPTSYPEDGKRRRPK